MGKIIAISNHKGGVGKTTSAINIGAGLAIKGKKVLLIDMDPQANLSQSLGVHEPSVGMYEALKGSSGLDPVNIQKNLSMIPASAGLGGAEIELASEAGREFILKELLESERDNYDFILIDCPPSLGLLTINAFTAADEIYIPMQAQYLALQGIGKLLGLVDKIKKRLNPTLEISGIFITQFDKRKVLNRYVMDTLESHFGDKVFKSRIRNNVSLAEAPNEGCDIFSYEPKSNGAFDYQQLVKEIIKRESAGSRNGN
jgi:chromosome partitioning protein